jgi:hypothetical protein
LWAINAKVGRIHELPRLDIRYLWLHSPAYHINGGSGSDQQAHTIVETGVTGGLMGDFKPLFGLSD